MPPPAGRVRATKKSTYAARICTTKRVIDYTMMKIPDAVKTSMTRKSRARIRARETDTTGNPSMIHPGGSRPPTRRVDAAPVMNMARKGVIEPAGEELGHPEGLSMALAVIRPSETAIRP